MVGSTVYDVVERHNAGRDPERLAMKYRAMYADAFSFFRGTCHLFYDAVPDVPELRDCPAAWLCGDLHMENFGSFKADNRLTYFDMNDFDEAILGPANWDLWRLLASVLVGAGSIGVDEATALSLCDTAAENFAASMREGKARWVERATAQGMVKTLLSNVKRRQRRRFLEGRTRLYRGKRTLLVDGRRALPATDAQRDAVVHVIGALARSQPNPDFYRVIDVARRIAGTGSLGLERYAILVEGRGGPDGHFLLDLKRAAPTSLARAVRTAQPNWASEAARVISVQHWMQAVSPALLAAVEVDGQSFLLKELQPTADRVDLDQWGGKLRRLQNVMATMGRVAAWAQLRAAGRHGAAGPDELIAYYAADGWKAPLTAQAHAAALLARRQWSEFRAASDRRAQT